MKIIAAYNERADIQETQTFHIADYAGSVCIFLMGIPCCSPKNKMWIQMT